MQVRVVNGGDAAFKSLLYQQPEQGVLDYLQGTFNKAMDTLGGVANSFMDTTKSIYNKYNSTQALEESKRLIYSLGIHTHQDQILPLQPEQIPQANYIMQRYIIANPAVNELYDDNMCNGFESTYFNEEVGVVGVDRNDYRRVMDGVVQFEEDGSGYINHYSSSDDVEELCAIEKFSVLDTWDSVAKLLSDGIDPTDPDGCEL